MTRSNQRNDPDTIQRKKGRAEVEHSHNNRTKKKNKKHKNLV